MVFDFEKWWLDNVGPEDNVLDIVLKKAAKEAVEAALAAYHVDTSEKPEIDDIEIDVGLFS